jgi:hypothetical protein
VFLVIRLGVSMESWEKVVLIVLEEITTCGTSFIEINLRG